MKKNWTVIGLGPAISITIKSTSHTPLDIKHWREISKYLLPLTLSIDEEENICENGILTVFLWPASPGWRMSWPAVVSMWARHLNCSLLPSGLWLISLIVLINCFSELLSEYYTHVDISCHGVFFGHWIYLIKYIS